jgi:hypothetical protein
VKRITRLAGRRVRLRPAQSRITGSNLLQTAVTILVAVALAVAALIASGAADRWQSSVRADVKRSAGIVEDVREVYGDEAPLGLDVALADTRARQGTDDDALTDRQHADEVGLVPRPWSSPAASRLGVTVALVAWLAVALLPVLALRFDDQEQRADALAARRAVDVSTMLAASGIAFSFRTHSLQRVIALDSHAIGRQIVALNSPDSDDGARLADLGRAEARTAQRARLVVAEMSRAPTARDGVDGATLEAVNASHAASDAVRVEQNEQADVAERAGRRANRMNLALLLSALTLSLAALAATGRGVRLRGIDRVAAAVLVAALGVAISAVLA